MMQLLAVVCLSLAAKIEESEAPLSVDLQVKKSHSYLLYAFITSFSFSSDI